LRSPVLEDNHAFYPCHLSESDSRIIYLG
jgi:hypothetical protein